MSSFIEKPVGKQSTARRKLVYGVGVNDADYMITVVVNGKQMICPYYDTWWHMLRRCYSVAHHKKSPTYVGYMVCFTWHTFSVFRAWMEIQDWQGKDLDKDVINPGNKVYSPEKCRFISHSLNSLLNSNTANRGKYPIGVSFHKKKGKLRAQCKNNGTVQHLGYYTTPEQAHQAYVTRKSAIILEQAHKQTDPKLKAGLIRHVHALTD